MKRCLQCGTLNENIEVVCIDCGTRHPDPVYAFGGSSFPSIPGSVESGNITNSTFNNRALAERQPAVRNSNPPLRDGVTVRIMSADPLMHEPPDFDGFRAATRAVWLLLFVGSPILIVYGLFQLAGVLPALLALFVILWSLRFLSPTNLFSLFHLAVMLNPMGRRTNESVPVRYYRVRTMVQGDERIVRVKGHLNLGNILPDDIVTFQGPWRGGVLRAVRAYNHRSEAEVGIQRSFSWVGFGFTLLVVAAIILLFAGPVGFALSRVLTFAQP